MIIQVSLVDGADRFDFQDPSLGNNDDVTWTSLNIGSPEIRGASENRVSGDGTFDRTRWHGARSVSMEARLAQAPAAKVDALSRFLHPVRRPYLVVTDTDWAPTSRRMMLRSNQWTTQDLIHTSSWFRDIQLQWTAPAGVWESFDQYLFTITLDATQSGFTLPASFPITFPPTGAAGAMPFTNPGNGMSDWVARLYGPCVGPRITNDLTGESVVFKSTLQLGVGEYVEVSSAELTAYANSDPTLSRMHHIDFASSTWFKVPPGNNVIRYNPVSDVDFGCSAEFEFRPTWL